MFSSDGRARRGARRARLALGAALLAGALIASCGGARPRRRPGARTAERARRAHRRPARRHDQQDADPQLDPGLRALRLLLRQQPALLPDPRHPADRALLPPHRGRDEPRRRRTSTTPRRSPPGSTRPAIETGLFGKYLNNYPWQRGAGYVPPGLGPLGRVHARRLLLRLHAGPRAGHRRRTARRPPTTRPTCSRRRVDDFIRVAQQPFFAWFAPYAPHAPRTPAPRDRDAFAGARVKLPANFNRVADGAPRWWGQRPRLERGDEQRATLASGARCRRSTTRSGASSRRCARRASSTTR